MRTVGVRRSHYHRIHTILLGIRHTESLCRTLRRRVTSPRRGTVHISAVCLGKRLFAGALSVDFARRDIKESLHAVVPAVVYQIGGAINIRLYYLHRTLGEEHRTGVARGVDDIVEHSVTGKRFADIEFYEVEPLVVPVAGKACMRPLLVASGGKYMV